ncbi:hypothetical protein [Luteolibacter marinus]|uniref:hypothetical protein n=1 Tax=Luteolibacter marinus TaxID=2776705 RepID=UPI0018696664|nr:hypothetical protein [Luteolibacter marinus]
MKKAAIIASSIIVILLILIFFWLGGHSAGGAAGLLESARLKLSGGRETSARSRRAIDPRLNEIYDGKHPATAEDFEDFLEAAGYSPEAWIVTYLGTTSQPAILAELKKFPDNPDACYILSLGVSTPFEALSWAQKLAALQPDNGYAKLVLANALEKQGRFQEAAELKKAALTSAEFHGYGEGAAKCLANHQASLGEREKLGLVTSALDSKFYYESQLAALRKAPEVEQDPRERIEALQAMLEKIDNGRGFAQFITPEAKEYTSQVTLVRLMASTSRTSNDPALIAELKPKLDAWTDPPDPRMNPMWNELEPAMVSKHLQDVLEPFKTP